MILHIESEMEWLSSSTQATDMAVGEKQADKKRRTRDRTVQARCTDSTKSLGLEKRSVFFWRGGISFSALYCCGFNVTPALRRASLHS
jgi:hypothetical protein